MTKTIMMTLLMAGIIPALVTTASEEEFLMWTSAVIQCGKTPEAGDVSCEIKAGDKGWEKFTIQAFGKTNVLTEVDLGKLKGFPLSSLRTTHEGGWKEFGGYTLHFRFERPRYNAEQKLVVTEIICVSVNKEGTSVSGVMTKQK